jgi:GNAT superfamily N-acetyltransferase
VLTPDEAPLAVSIAARYPYKPYRHHRVWSRARQLAIQQADVERTLAGDGGFAVVTASDKAEGVVTGRPLTWDSEFFGVPMGRLDGVFSDEALPNATLADAIRVALAHLQGQGVRHVTAKVDAADVRAVGLLEDAGFRLVDALVTYYTHPHRDVPPVVREIGEVRWYAPSDEAQVLALTADAYRGFRGRFHLDPHLPTDRADAFYVEWARQCCAGRMADRMVVADDGQGHIYGWASSRLLEPLSSVGGTRLWVGSLGACRRDSPGAYAGLLRRLAIDHYDRGDASETQTQNHNIATVRLYETVGFRYIRTEYTMHAWMP